MMTLLLPLLGLLCTGEADRPNVILMMADDMGWGDPHYMGNKRIHTPHLDAMAAAGLRFNRFYSGAPVCAPSRNVLLTGCHLGHVTMRDNRPARDEQGKRVEGQLRLGFPNPRQ